MSSLEDWVMGIMGDTRTEAEVAQDKAVTEALERGEPTYVDPTTGMTKNVSDYNRDYAPPTPGGLLAQMNPDSITLSPVQIGVGLLDPSVPIANLLSNLAFQKGIQDFDPWAIDFSLSKDPWHGITNYTYGPGWDPENSPQNASYPYANAGYNRGAVTVENLGPVGGGGAGGDGGGLGGADSFSDSDTSGDFFCLSPDTKVKTKEGLKEVRDLKAGDDIKSIYGYGTVIEVIDNHIRNGYYCINDDFHITNDHPILTKKGWYRTEDLKIGDDLGGTIVKSIDYIEGPVETVSITTDTEDFNVYGKDVVYSVNGRYKLSLFKNAA